MAFTPLSLFAAGEQGVWYQNSDLTTLFQDAAGTTPVTGYEQFVGLRLDKSKSGVGTNGAKRINLLNYTEQFDDTYWIKFNTTISSNTGATTDPLGSNTADVAIATSTNTYHAIYRAGNTVTSASYVFTVYAKAGGYNYVGLILSNNEIFTKYYEGVFNLANGTIETGTSRSVTYTGSRSITDVGNGWYRCSITITLTDANSTARAQVQVMSTNDPTVTFAGNTTSGVSIWGADLRLASEAATLPTYQPITSGWPATMPGNHAFQSTTTARAVLSARYNLLTETENFAAAAWSVNAVSRASVTAPDGTSTAVSITGNGVSSLHIIRQGTPSTSAQRKIRVVAKAGTNNFIQIFSDGVTNEWVNFDLGVGAVGSSAAAVSDASISLLGNGWYVCEAVFTTILGASSGINFCLITSASAGRAETNTLSTSVLLWHPDLRVANESSALPAYQRVGAAVNGTSTSIGTPDYDTVGFPAYLRYDGGDWYQTNSIDFTATDEMSVFAGVRKLSDDATGQLLQLGIGGSNGTFYLAAPNNVVPASYLWTPRGSSNALTSANGFFAPTTNIVTGLADISGDMSRIRVNAIQVNEVTSDQGAGNFGNYPLYIGAISTPSLFFTGRDYGFVIVGRAVTASELTNTEDYMDVQTFGKNMTLVYSDELTTATGDPITAADGDPIYMTVTYQ